MRFGANLDFCSLSQVLKTLTCLNLNIVCWFVCFFSYHTWPIFLRSNWRVNLLNTLCLLCSFKERRSFQWICLYLLCLRFILFDLKLTLNIFSEGLDHLGHLSSLLVVSSHWRLAHQISCEGSS